MRSAQTYRQTGKTDRKDRQTDRRMDRQTFIGQVGWKRLLNHVHVIFELVNNKPDRHRVQREQRDRREHQEGVCVCFTTEKKINEMKIRK